MSQPKPKYNTIDEQIARYKYLLNVAEFWKLRDIELAFQMRFQVNPQYLLNSGILKRIPFFWSLWVPVGDNKQKARHKIAKKVDVLQLMEAFQHNLVPANQDQAVQ